MDSINFGRLRFLAFQSPEILCNYVEVALFGHFVEFEQHFLLEIQEVAAVRLSIDGRLLFRLTFDSEFVGRH